MRHSSCGMANQLCCRSRLVAKAGPQIVRQKASLAQPMSQWQKLACHVVSTGCRLHSCSSSGAQYCTVLCAERTMLDDGRHRPLNTLCMLQAPSTRRLVLARTQSTATSPSPAQRLVGPALATLPTSRARHQPPLPPLPPTRQEALHAGCLSLPLPVPTESYALEKCRRRAAAVSCCSHGCSCSRRHQ